MRNFVNCSHPGNPEAAFLAHLYEITPEIAERGRIARRDSKLQAFRFERQGVIRGKHRRGRHAPPSRPIEPHASVHAEEFALIAELFRATRRGVK